MGKLGHHRKYGGSYIGQFGGNGIGKMNHLAKLIHKIGFRIVLAKKTQQFKEKNYFWKQEHSHTNVNLINTRKIWVLQLVIEKRVWQ
jgi:hypothetical protein